MVLLNSVGQILENLVWIVENDKTCFGHKYEGRRGKNDASVQFGYVFG